MLEFFPEDTEDFEVKPSWIIYWKITIPITVFVILCILVLQGWSLLTAWLKGGGSQPPPDAASTQTTPVPGNPVAHHPSVEFLYGKPQNFNALRQVDLEKGRSQERASD